jgi:hypothetical protein
MVAPQEIQDRLAIREVIELYSMSVTRRDWESLAGCFTAEARWHTSVGHDFRSRQRIREGIRAIAEGMEFLVQMSHGVVITQLAAERAKATVVINEVGKYGGNKGGLFALGVYYDSLVKEDGRWMFEDRDFRAHYIDLSPVSGRVLVDYSAQP